MPFYQRILDDRLLGSLFAEGSGWTGVTGLHELFDNARRLKRLLYLRPGIYRSRPIRVSGAGGSGYPLNATAAPGTVTIVLSEPGPYLFRIDDLRDVSFTNLVLDGGRLNQEDATPTAGLVAFHGEGASGFEIRGCEILNSATAGVSCGSGAAGRISHNHLHRCDSGVFCLDAQVSVDNNRIGACSNNGVQVWNSRVTENSSTVAQNHIETIAAAKGGTGPYGNGVVVYRAYGVKIVDNTIIDTRYSAIRLNAAGNCHVERNRCSQAREVAIFVEAPQQGLDLDGGIVAENIIERSGSGIQVANAGLYGDGVSRRVTVANNQISRLTRTYIPEERAFTAAIGIIVEGSCNVVGNSIEHAAVAGIMAGTNNASTDLLVAGNFIRSCPMGIGYSANPAAAGTLIANNLISDFVEATDPVAADYLHSGAIVAARFTGSDYIRDAPGGTASADYGNVPQTTVGPLTVGMNKAR